MNDREFAKQRKRILACDAKWGPLLGLRWWTVTHVYCRDRDEMPEDARSSAAAAVRSHWQYMTASVYWYIPDIADVDAKELESIYIHEALHILVNEMRVKDLDHEERVVSHLTKVILWVKEGFPERKEA